jgi:hypothetical protein
VHQARRVERLNSVRHSPMRAPAHPAARDAGALRAPRVRIAQRFANTGNAGGR